MTTWPLSVQRALERDPNRHTDSFVYLAIARPSGLVKIGRATDARGRIRTLQTGNHEELSMIACLAGGKALERDVHQLFAADRVRGEWFRGSTMMKELVVAAYYAAHPDEVAA
jgi:hypothetical protein